MYITALTGHPSTELCVHVPSTHHLHVTPPPPSPSPSHVSRYPTTVATLSRRARDVVEAAFEATSDGGASSPLVPSRLHDFGFRGCTSVEQSVIGGCAHLLSFTGSDTMSAAYYAQVIVRKAFHSPASEMLQHLWGAVRDCKCNCTMRGGRIS